MVLAVFQASSGFGFRDVCSVELLYECESCVFVEVVIGEVEVFVERATVATRDVVSMSIYSKVGRGLALPDVLRAFAKGTVC